MLMLVGNLGCIAKCAAFDFREDLWVLRWVVGRVLSWAESESYRVA